MQTGTEEANGNGLAAPSGLPATFHPSTIRTLRRLLTKESLPVCVCGESLCGCIAKIHF